MGSSLQQSSLAYTGVRMSVPQEFHAHLPERPNAGVLKDRERTEALEREIAQTLGTLAGHLTTKSLGELRTIVESSQDLKSLKEALCAHADAEGSPALTEETVQALMALIEQAREVSKQHIESLRLDIQTLRRTPTWTPDPETYFPTHRLTLAKKIEESPLGENIIIDISGLMLGLADSAYTVFQVLVAFLADFVRLPRDIAATFGWMPLTTEKTAHKDA